MRVEEGLIWKESEIDLFVNEELLISAANLLSAQLLMRIRRKSHKAICSHWCFTLICRPNWKGGECVLVTRKETRDEREEKACGGGLLRPPPPKTNNPSIALHRDMYKDGDTRHGHGAGERQRGDVPPSMRCDLNTLNF